MSTERRYVNPKTGEVIDDPEIRPFNQILAELGEGSTVVELSQAMWDLLQRRIPPEPRPARHSGHHRHHHQTGSQLS